MRVPDENFPVGRSCIERGSILNNSALPVVVTASPLGIAISALASPASKFFRRPQNIPIGGGPPLDSDEINGG